MTDRSGIFARVAPVYWAAGLPAIPVIAGEKRPAIDRWQVYANAMPTLDEQAVWLDAFPDGNIGMTMGPVSGLVAIDIDTDDPVALKAIMSVLPPSPWLRRGRKGMVLVYRFNGERTNRLKAMDGSIVCEVLAKGAQIVLPPSIHPTTRKPYHANADLLDVRRQVQLLPPDVALRLQAALGAAGIEATVGNAGARTTVWVPAGSRDNQMGWMAGPLARAVTRGERSLLEVLGEMEVWVEGYVEKVVGDPLSVDTARRKVLEFLMNDLRSDRRIALPPGWDEGLSEEDKTKLGLNIDADDEVWTTDRVYEFLGAGITAHSDPSSKEFVGMIKAALDRIARSGPEISGLDEHRLLSFICTHSNHTLSMTALRRELQVLRQGELEDATHTEIAEAVVERFSQFGEVRFDAGKFWQWRGAHWEPTDIVQLKRMIATDFGHYAAMKKEHDHVQIARLVQTLRSVPLARFRQRGVNFANGFLTEDLELVPHHPDQGMTYTLPYRYMPEAAGHMPLFNQFLMDCWGDDPDYMDKVAALQEAMGVTLFGQATSYQRAVLLFGKSGSGKSRLPALLGEFLPPSSTCSIPPQEWSDRFLPASLFGKVFNFAGELSESRLIPGDSFKTIVSGEKITAQHKNQQPFEFHPAAAHWFCSNHLPRSKDTSQGFSRRWLILLFDTRVDQSRRIADLEKVILESEAEAIAAWAVQGYIRLKKNGAYTLPASHMACVEEMDRANNPVKFFLTRAAEVKFADDAVVPSGVLHRGYRAFCLTQGIRRRASLPDFEKRMSELQGELAFTVTRQGRENVYRGIRFEA